MAMRARVSSEHVEPRRDGGRRHRAFADALSLARVASGMTWPGLNSVAGEKCLPL